MSTLLPAFLLAVTGCSSHPCKEGPLEVWPGPWAELDFPTSETAGVCRVDEDSLQHLRSTSSVSKVLEEVEAALKADGWAPEPRALNETEPDGAEARSWIKGEVMLEVHVNQAAVEPLTVLTIYDRSDKKPYTAVLPDDYPERVAAGEAVLEGVRAQLAKGDREAKACPKGQGMGVLVDYRLLSEDGSGVDTLAPLLNGHDYQQALDADLDSSEGKETWMKLYDKVVARGVVVARVEEWRAAGGGYGTGSFESGVVRGQVSVFDGDEMVCQVPFYAQSSEQILEGDQHNDLKSNALAGVRSAVSGR